MFDKCPYNDRSRCNIWLDYQVCCLALEDAEELADENWKEIDYLLNRVDRVEFLEKLLEVSGIEIPPKF